jgi:hypothetical protein
LAAGTADSFSRLDGVCSRRNLEVREYVMSIRSWFGFGRSRRRTGKRSLIRNRRDNAKLQRIREAAAADIAAVREDDKYFDPRSPGNQQPY